MNDKQLVRERFEASFPKYDKIARVQQDICLGLVRLLSEATRSREFNRIVEIGAGTGFLTSGLTNRFPQAQFVVNDLASGAEKFLAKYLADIHHSYLWGDAEEIAFPQNQDLVATASTIQWFDDLPSFFINVNKMLDTGGIFLFSTFGSGNFREIKSASGEGLNYIGHEEISGLLNASGFQILSSSQYTEQMLFDSPLEVLHHIKATGVNSIRKTKWGRGDLQHYNQTYLSQYLRPDGKVPLTYHPILFLAKKVKAVSIITSPLPAFARESL